MSTISNRFFVTALEDGSTLHGNLAVDGNLTQAWNGSSAVPDWSIAANQPKIYLTLLNGNEYVTVTDNFRWQYNGVDIVFDQTTNKSTNADFANVFLKTTYNLQYTDGSGQTQSITMPALQIIDNIASSDNVDLDTVTFIGSYPVLGVNVGFSASAQIRISEISANGYLGVLNFKDGIANFTSKGQKVMVYGQLFAGSDSAGTAFSATWKVNGTTFNTTNFPNSRTTTYSGHPALELDERDIVDNAVVSCAMSVGGDVKYTAYASIDDMQDAEYMYIQYKNGSGNAASLHKDESAQFSIWVGTRDDASVLGGTSSPQYGYIDVQLLDATGAVITGSHTGLPSETSSGSGIRPLPMSQGKGSITISYDNCYSSSVGKKSITGIVIAYTSNPH